ncbi:MAG: hypothetical protein OXT65_03080 [Alphaproteobacteria bacterium]|nr:hypothetical protein [Alphaproteobacteria bacterium]
MSNAAQQRQQKTLSVEQDEIRAAQPHWAEQSAKKMRNTLQMMFLAVAIPTLVSFVYFFFIAAGQYQSETHMTVRAAGSGPSPALFGMMMGLNGMGQSSQDVRSIVEYVHSRDAVKALEGKIGLRAMFTHPDADFVARLPKGATFEELYDYYMNRVDVTFDIDSGSAIIHTRAFTAEDAHKIAANILTLSEELINGFNDRAERDALRLSQERVTEAEERMKDVRKRMAQFRMAHQDIDPAMKSGAISGLISGLEAEHAKLSAEVKAMSSYMTSENTQVVLARKKLAALNAQIKQEQKRLTGGEGAYTQKIAGYEELMTEHEIATQAYTAALTSLESARLEAQRQKSYVVPVVEPIAAETAEYPKRGQSVFLTFILSFLIFGIGRLILAGLKDHVVN